MGTRDYIRKCGFERVIIGLSGGIDSSLTAAIAVDAVGKQNVIGVGMPGPYSSEHSVSDARDLAHNFGIRFELISIREQYEAFLEASESGVRRRNGRGDGGEPSIPAAWRDPDGDVEQMGSSRPHYWQQERARGWLLHALWRYVRRPGRDQRRAQNHGLCALSRRQ